MNRTLISIAAVLTALTAQTGQAQDHSNYSFELPAARASAAVGKTRAEVKAELKEAMAKGQIVQGDRDPAPIFASPSVLNRLDVQREAIEANKSRNSVYQERG